jgi:hypothetical protein
MRPAALSNPSPEQRIPNQTPTPTRFRKPGRQHSFVQQNQPHRFDQPANLDSSASAWSSSITLSAADGKADSWRSDRFSALSRSACPRCVTRQMRLRLFVQTDQLIASPLENLS